MNWFIYCKRLESLGYAFNTYCEMCQIPNYAFATYTSFQKCEYISGDRVIYASRMYLVFVQDDFKPFLNFVISL